MGDKVVHCTDSRVLDLFELRDGGLVLQQARAACNILLQMFDISGKLCPGSFEEAVPF
jgi:hypothetical protein